MRYRTEAGPDLGRGALADEGREEHYRGWLPSAKFLLPGEILAAVFVVEFAWTVWLVAMGVIRTGLEIPVPEQIAHHPVLSGVLTGLLVGLYVLMRLRSMRLARREHLRGER